MAVSSFVSAATAAARLGVKRATLYAYVSRGRLEAYSLPGQRGSWFDPLQLDGLTRRARQPEARRPDLRVTSAVTAIEHGRCFYRGLAPETLAASHPFEAVAEWLWHGTMPSGGPTWPVDGAALREARVVQATLPAAASATDRLRVVVAVLGVLDPLRFDRRPAGAVATARRLVATTLATMARRRGDSIAAQVASWIGVPRGRPDAVAAVDDVLVLMADHELAASTVAVRVAASFGADPYAAVAAGLGAMSGSRHGAASRPIEEALAAMAQNATATRAAVSLLTDPAAVPGFGHPLYPAGDPRVAPVLALARRFGSPRRAEALASVARTQGLPAPNVDFALAAFTHALGVAPGAGEALFSAARLAGWLAHALEEYASRTDFRLRAVYTGPRPAPP